MFLAAVGDRPLLHVADSVHMPCCVQERALILRKKQSEASTHGETSLAAVSLKLTARDWVGEK